MCVHERECVDVCMRESVCVYDREKLCVHELECVCMRERESKNKIQFLILFDDIGSNLST